MTYGAPRIAWEALPREATDASATVWGAKVEILGAYHEGEGA